MAARQIFHSTATGELHIEINDGTSSTLPPIIYLHGLGGSTNFFEPLIPYFSSHTQIRVDFPGLGRSPLPAPGRLTVPGLVSDLENLVDAYGGQKVILAGHSMGAIVAMHYAAKHTSRVIGLCLIGPGRSAAKIPAVKERFQGMAKKAREEGMTALADSTVENNCAPSSSGLVRAFVREVIMAQNGEGYAASCEALVDESHVDPNYSAITAPTVVIAGDQDKICPMERAVQLQGLIGEEKAAELVVVKSGHQQVLEDTEGVVEALKTLLAKL